MNPPETGKRRTSSHDRDDDISTTNPSSLLQTEPGKRLSSLEAPRQSQRISSLNPSDITKRVSTTQLSSDKSFHRTSSLNPSDISRRISQQSSEIEKDNTSGMTVATLSKPLDQTNLSAGSLSSSKKKKGIDNVLESTTLVRTRKSGKVEEKLPIGIPDKFLLDFEKKTLHSHTVTDENETTLTSAEKAEKNRKENQKIDPEYNDDEDDENSSNNEGKEEDSDTIHIHRRKKIALQNMHEQKRIQSRKKYTAVLGETDPLHRARTRNALPCLTSLSMLLKTYPHFQQLEEIFIETDTYMSEIGDQRRGAMQIGGMSNYGDDDEMSSQFGGSSKRVSRISKGQSPSIYDSSRMETGSRMSRLQSQKSEIMSRGLQSSVCGDSSVATRVLPFKRLPSGRLGDGMKQDGESPTMDQSPKHSKTASNFGSKLSTFGGKVPSHRNSRVGDASDSRRGSKESLQLPSASVKRLSTGRGSMNYGSAANSINLGAGDSFGGRRATEEDTIGRRGSGVSRSSINNVRHALELFNRNIHNVRTVLENEPRKSKKKIRKSKQKAGPPFLAGDHRSPKMASMVTRPSEIEPNYTEQFESPRHGHGRPRPEDRHHIYPKSFTDIDVTKVANLLVREKKMTGSLEATLIIWHMCRHAEFRIPITMTLKIMDEPEEKDKKTGDSSSVGDSKAETKPTNLKFDVKDNSKDGGSVPSVIDDDKKKEDEKSYRSKVNYYITYVILIQGNQMAVVCRCPIPGIRAFIGEIVWRKIYLNVTWSVNG